MTPISSNTPISTCVNEYTVNPVSVEQKNHNVAIVKNITNKLKECCGNNHRSLVEQKRLAMEALESANQKLLNETLEYSATLLLKKDFNIMYNIEYIINFLLSAGAEITDKAKQVFLASYISNINESQSDKCYESDRRYCIKQANRVRAYTGESVISEEHLKVQQEILKNQQEIIKTQQETIEKFNEQMAILLDKIDDTENKVKKGCVIC